MKSKSILIAAVVLLLLITGAVIINRGNQTSSVTAGATNAPLPTPLHFDVQGLIHAVAHNQSLDAFHPNLTTKQWELFGTYLQPFAVRQGQVVIEQNASDRTVYFVESGTLTVHYEDDKKRLRLTSVESGSAVGEGAFFTRLPRNATV